jgi:phenylalanyl-tRNA synthetase beta chain
VCGSFAPTLIGKTTQRLGLTTTVGRRFAYGTDLTMVPYAALRVAELVSKGIEEARGQNPTLPKARVSKDFIDLGVGPSGPRLIAMRLSHGRDFLGMSDLTRSTVTQALSQFSFRFVDGTEDRLVFEIPSFRPDIEREIDLIAELSRILGVSQVPPQALPPIGKALLRPGH